MRQSAQELYKSIKVSLIGLLALALPSYTNAAGLARAKGALETIKGELLTIIPVVAVIALILLAIGYAICSVEKETFWRWAIGVIVAGSAAEITAMLFS